MNMENKYRKPFTISGILSLVTFFLLLSLLLFTGTREEGSLSETAGALLLLFSSLVALVYFVSIILTFVFFYLKRSQQKRISLLFSGVSASSLTEEDTVYQIETDSSSKFVPLFKGLYYSSRATFYLILLSLAFAIIILSIFVPSSLDNRQVMIGAGVALLVCMSLLFLLVYVFYPLSVFSTTKKQKVRQRITLTDSLIRVEGCADMSQGMMKGAMNTDLLIPYGSMIKARKDKTSYYFLYLNEKGKQICLVLTYQDMPLMTKEISAFLDGKMNEINHRK